MEVRPVLEPAEALADPLDQRIQTAILQRALGRSTRSPPRRWFRYPRSNETTNNDPSGRPSPRAPCGLQPTTAWQPGYPEHFAVDRQRVSSGKSVVRSDRKFHRSVPLRRSLRAPLCAARRGDRWCVWMIASRRCQLGRVPAHVFLNRSENPVNFPFEVVKTAALRFALRQRSRRRRTEVHGVRSHGGIRVR